MIAFSRSVLGTCVYSKQSRKSVSLCWETVIHAYESWNPWFSKFFSIDLVWRKRESFGCWMRTCVFRNDLWSLPNLAIQETDPTKTEATLKMRASNEASLVPVSSSSASFRTAYWMYRNGKSSRKTLMIFPLVRTYASCFLRGIKNKSPTNTVNMPLHKKFIIPILEA